MDRKSNNSCNGTTSFNRGQVSVGSFLHLWLLTISCFSITQVQASSTVNLDLRIERFTNSLNVMKSGLCCDGSAPKWAVSPPCSSSCNTAVFICVGNYEPQSYQRWQPVQADDEQQCSLAYAQLGPFPESDLGPLNLSLPLAGAPHAFTVQIVVRHAKTFSERDSVIALYYINDADATPNVWKSRSLSDSPARAAASNRPLAYIALTYAVSCAANFFGSTCADYCAPRNDTFGHYSCLSDGSVQCLPGWTGSMCTSPVCSAGCDLLRGSCSLPFTCNCQPGWSGSNCTQCITYPGCSAKHGYCVNPYDCLCEFGWSGDLCDQDISASSQCASNPCANGGVCQTNRTASANSNNWYVCQCPPGYTGALCEQQLSKWTQNCSAQQAKQCHNAASCQVEVVRNQSSNVSCTCLPEYSGKFCEVDDTPCSPNPCLNGGSCSASQSVTSCVCPAGFSGTRCEQLVSSTSQPTVLSTSTNTPTTTSKAAVVGTDICSLQPCVNFQICLYLGSATFECICPPPYTGETCDRTDSNGMQHSDGPLSSLLSSPAMAAVTVLGVVLPAMTIVVVIVILVVVVKRRKLQRRRRKQLSNKQLAERKVVCTYESLDQAAQSGLSPVKTSHKLTGNPQLHVLLDTTHAGNLQCTAHCPHCRRPSLWASPGLACGGQFSSLRTCKRACKDAVQRSDSDLMSLPGKAESDESAAYRSTVLHCKAHEKSAVGNGTVKVSGCASKVSLQLVKPGGELLEERIWNQRQRHARVNERLTVAGNCADVHGKSAPLLCSPILECTHSSAV